MSQIKKLLNYFLGEPKGFTYNELKKLLKYFGYQEAKLGKASGSRVAFIHQQTKHIIRLHKPHPSSELKDYQITDIKKELQKEGFIEP